MDITQELRYKMLVERKNYVFFVDFEYENLPDYCSHCLKIGHHVDDCRLLHKKSPTDAHQQPTNVINGFRVTKDGRKKQGNHVEDPIVVEEATDNVRKNQGASIVKSVGVPNPVTEEPVGLPKNNRFEALSNEVGSVMKEKDLELEKEINEELEKVVEDQPESSSNVSEFVETTQVMNECYGASGSEC